MNSRKHGLSAKALMIDGEDPAEFDRLHKSLLEEFNPCPGAEVELIFRLASLLWRARRVPVFEASFLRTQQSEGAYRDPRVDALIELEIRRITKLQEISSRYLPGKKSVQDRDEIERTVIKQYEELRTPPNQPVTSPGENQENWASLRTWSLT